MSAAGEPARPNRLGRYELITRIGQGGMADVQLALQRGPAGFEKLVVVKLVHSNLASQKAFVDMLLDEARVAALVKHPNVVDIYDLGQAEGRFFIAMEYLEGEPLLAVLRAGREGKRLDPLSTGRLIADTAEGLDAAHELRSMSGERLELVHHDISLGNIVVLYNGQVKLVDFGVAKATQAGTKTKVQGKFSYMAPEKLRGDAGDRRSDIFSLGCVMWEALTLKRLFRGGNDTETMKQVLEMAIQPPSKVNAEVPPEYDAIVMRSLDRNPARRQRTAKELAVELEELLRKRGYGGKNDRIARYMQETFKDHIDARKKLVQEVVSKGSASAEVLDAAFNEPAFASGSPVPPVQGAEFSVKNYRRITPAAGIPALKASGSGGLPAPAPYDSIDEDDKATVVVATKSAPISEPAGGPAARSGLPAPRAKAPTASPPPRPKAPTAAPPPRPKAPTAAPPTRPSAGTAKPSEPPAPAAGSALPLPAPADVTPLPGTHVPTNVTTDVDIVPVTEVDAQPIGDASPSLTASNVLLYEETGQVEGKRGFIASVLADKTKRLYAIGLAGALLLLLIAILVSGGSKKKHPVADAGSNAVGAGSDDHGSAADPNGSAAMDTQPPPDAGEATDASDDHADNTPNAGSGSGSDSVEQHVEQHVDHTDHSDHTNHTDHSDHRRPPPPPPPPSIDVEDTVQKGLQAFVKGDANGALALLLKAKAAKPGYSPTYRVLGRVYKKLGNNAEAKKAFQKYLQLAPKAPDAGTIDQEIKKL